MDGMGVLNADAGKAFDRFAFFNRADQELVVDDNEEVGMFAETLLEEIGYKVVRSSSGEEALDRARAEAFDLVFTDIVMPGMSGLQLADILRTEKPSLAVILTTGFSDEVLKSGTGGRAVVLKPYRLETLTEAIDEALAKG